MNKKWKKEKFFREIKTFAEVFVSLIIVECGAIMYFRHLNSDVCSLTVMGVGIYLAAEALISAETAAKKVRVYIDMDGCLAKWDPDATIQDTHRAGFFLSRKPETRLIEAVKILQEEGVDVRILSKVYNDSAANEKAVWLRRHGLGDIPAIFVPYEGDKSAYIMKGNRTNLLLDDFSENLREWERDKKNVAVKFRNAINGTKGTWTGDSVYYYQSAETIANEIVNAGIKKANKLVA